MQSIIKIRGHKLQEWVSHTKHRKKKKNDVTIRGLSLSVIVLLRTIMPVSANRWYNKAKILLIAVGLKKIPDRVL